MPVQPSHSATAPVIRSDRGSGFRTAHPHGEVQVPVTIEVAGSERDHLPACKGLDVELFEEPSLAVQVGRHARG